jgi:hypothetical protein
VLRCWSLRKFVQDGWEKVSPFCKFSLTGSQTFLRRPIHFWNVFSTHGCNINVNYLNKAIEMYILAKQQTHICFNNHKNKASTWVALSLFQNKICREVFFLLCYSSAHKPVCQESLKPFKHLAGVHHYNIHRERELARKLFCFASACFLIFGVAWQLHIEAVFHSASISVWDKLKSRILRS